MLIDINPQSLYSGIPAVGNLSRINNSQTYTRTGSMQQSILTRSM